MIKLFLYITAMLLIFYNNISWNLFQIMLLVSIVLFIVNSNFSFFSCISYGYGIDYYSYGLIILSLLIVSLIIISSNFISNSSLMNFFLFVNLVLCVSLVLVFCSLNILLMYLFFEFSLIPLLVLIYIWGYQPERLISGLYLFFYTLFASLPFLLLLMYLILNNMTLYFDIGFFIPHSFLIHIFIIFAFLVNLPIFIVHFWLPKAHVQAPVSGSIILAGLRTTDDG